MKYEKYLNRLASNSPTPGGGGASAIAGALASALASMTVSFTIDNEKYFAVKEDMLGHEQELGYIREELLSYAEEDEVAYNNFSKSLKLPKTNAKELRIRKKEMQLAIRDCIFVPIKIANCCMRLLTLLEDISMKGNSNLASDTFCSAILAYASLRCAIQNVYANLKYIDDINFASNIMKEVDNLELGASRSEEMILTRGNR